MVQSSGHKGIPTYLRSGLSFSNQNFVFSVNSPFGNRWQLIDKSFCSEHRPWAKVPTSSLSQ